MQKRAAYKKKHQIIIMPNNEIDDFNNVSQNIGRKKMHFKDTL